MNPSAPPQVHRLHLADVQLPSWHPRAADGTAPVYGYAVEHPDGLILFDTGVGAGNQLIDEMYQPTVTPIVSALHTAGLDDGDVVAIVLSHLHFDHCGQASAFPGAPVYVQRAEVEAARAPRYTVAEWTHFERTVVVEGGHELAEGVTLMSTPGHTPGHQSLVVRGGGKTVVLAGQAAYTVAGLDELEPDNLHDPEWETAARASLERIRALRPVAVYLAHDARVWRRG